MKIKYLALAVLAACAGNVLAGEVQFANAPVPTNDLDKRSILTSQFAVIDGKKTDVDYNTIMRSGDKPRGSAAPFGQIINSQGQPVRFEDGSEFISNSNDFSSLLKGKRGGLFMVSHFESRPAAMYLTQMHQDKDGKLVPVKTRPLDFSHVKGGWVHCAGSVSPWGTHMGSEEYPPNSKEWRDGNVSDYNAQMVRYFPEGQGAADAELPALALQYMNPYDYGFVVEVDVKNYRNADVVKHYSMGRVAIELSYVMPNKKTVYISDDGSRVGLFRYEADKPGDLTAGTLYVAKWNQTSPWTNDQERIYPLDGGAANIDWVELGHATDAEIRNIIDSGIGFKDIFDEDVAGCTVISNRDASSECLKVKDGMEKAAAFLETSRYAGIQGGTVEFEKMEGITLNPDTKTMYLAMSRVRGEMVDGKGDISVPYNYCGTVYALDLDDDYVATAMHGLVNGVPRLYKRGAVQDNPYPADGPYAANECDLNGISEPDNVTFIPGYDTLIIGEDTGKHQNDVIWAYNLSADQLTRIQTTPYGSETTSPYIYPNVGNHAYLMSVVQHPFGESDQDKLMFDDEARAYTGYVGPFPALDGGNTGSFPHHHHHGHDREDGHRGWH